MSDTRKRRDLNVKDKLSILERYDKLPKMSQRNAASRLKISQPLLCKILKNRNGLMSAHKQNANLNTKRNRSGKDNEVESALKLWYTSVREQDASTVCKGPEIRQKAEELATKMGKKEFVATEGWFHRWKKRENIDCKRTTGVDLEAAESWIEIEWPKINSEFSMSNTYIADETGLYYQILADDVQLLRNEEKEECESPNEHVTILCCTNMSGEKEKLVVVGKIKDPLCFKGVKNLPVDYYSNSNAWMTSFIFNDWLKKWDAKLDRNIVLLVDDSTAHNVNTFLKHIKVEFLPVNTRSITQPCEQGIIRTMKACYRAELRSRSKQTISKPSFLDVLHLLAMSWDDVTDVIIKNCFWHSGLSKDNDGEDCTEEVLPVYPSDMTKKDFDAWMAIDKNIIVTAKLTGDDLFGATTMKKGEEAYDNGAAKDEIEYEISPPTEDAMRRALGILRRGVQYRSENFRKQYEYERFINDLLSQNK